MDKTRDNDDRNNDRNGEKRGGFFESEKRRGKGGMVVVRDALLPTYLPACMPASFFLPSTQKPKQNALRQGGLCSCDVLHRSFVGL